MKTFFAFCENNCLQRIRFRYDERVTRNKRYETTRHNTPDRQHILQSNQIFRESHMGLQVDQITPSMVEATRIHQLSRLKPSRGATAKRTANTNQKAMKTLPDIKPYTSILVVEAQRQAKVAALKQQILDMIEAEKKAAQDLIAAINQSKP
jgi:hypothetical protein